MRRAGRVSLVVRLVLNQHTSVATTIRIVCIGIGSLEDDIG